MPNVPIIDTHVHFWDPTLLRYPWLDDNSLLNKAYMPDNYLESTKETSIDKMVFVQCECLPSQCEEEVAWASRLAQADPRIQGIVAWAPLENGDVVRDTLIRYAQNPLVKGIRRIIQFEPDPAFCLQPDFIRGVQMLPEYQMSFDICIAHSHLRNTIALVKQCPEVRFVLDHVGKPDIAGRLLEPWRSEICQLAAFENVHCKLSGLVTEANHANWETDHLRPFVATILENFGVDRLLFGGDWPVLCQAATYAQWVNCLDTLLEGLTPGELRKIYGDNAKAFYHLT